jgi:hypothetical protein
MQLRKGSNELVGFIVSVFSGGREIPSFKLVEIVGDRVAVKVEALGNEAGLCSLMPHADNEPFDLSLFGVGGVRR